jgi:hypothetical protein
MYVSFLVKAPASGVVTYAQVPDAVPDESHVKVLHVYVFGPNGGASGTTDDYSLEGLFTYREPTLVATDYTVDNIRVTGKNIKHIYFIANRNVVPGSVGAMKETAMVNALCDAVSSSGDQPYISLTGHANFPWDKLPMSAYTEVDFSSGTPSPSTNLGVALLRAVARIDVVNATQNFTVEGMFVRSRDRGYYFPSAFDPATGAYIGLRYAGMNAFTLPATDQRTDGYTGTKILYGIVDFAAVHGSVLAPGTGNPIVPTSRLGAGYLYEASAADSASLVVRCVDNVNGGLRYIEIPFEQGYPLASIAVERNYVYTFRIDETTYRGLEASFIVAQWEDSPAVLEVDVPMGIAFSMAILPTAPLSNGESFKANASGGYDLTDIPQTGGSYVININSHAVPIAPDNTQMGLYPWIQNFTISPLKADNTFDISFDILSYTGATYPRTGSIVLKGNLPTSPTVTLGLSQNY